MADIPRASAIVLANASAITGVAIASNMVPADKVTVIPNAVDIEAFEPGGAPDEAWLRALLPRAA